jgi:flagellar motor switch protein FliG
MKLLRGPDKVAALLLSLDKETAGRILSNFDQVELRILTKTTSELGLVPPEQLNGIVEELKKNIDNGVEIQGAAGHAESLLQSILPPDQVAEIMSDVLGSTNQSIWEKLTTIQEAIFASYIVREHPQTAVLILSKVHPTCASKVISLLPRDNRNILIKRMLNPKPVSDFILKTIENTLQEDLLMNVAKNIAADIHTRMADIINKMERDNMEDVLTCLEETNPKEVEILKGLLFTFDDIIKITPRNRTLLFDRVPSDKIIVALNGVDQKFKDAVLSSLTSRARRLVENELNSSGALPQREVSKARREIADMALELANRNEIDLSINDEMND